MLRSFLAGSIVFVATAVAHWPARDGTILNIDDRRAFFGDAWRGLAWANVRYAFGTLDMGMYRPLTWLSYGADYALFGFDPSAMHRTSLLLHVLVAVLLFVFLLRYLRANGRESLVAATLMTLAFSLHPLRVQVVAWLSARADALAAVFFLAASIAWLAWITDRRPRARFAWHALFAASLLAKPAALLAPFVWWLAAPRSQRGRLDLAIGTACSTAVALPVLVAKSVLGPPGGVPQLPRIAALTAPHNAVFFLWKTVWPSALGYYEPATPFSLLTMPYVAGAMVAVAIGWGVWHLRVRVPGLLLTLASYLLLLLPVIGLVPFGYELVADRFAYLPALALSVGAAIAVARAERRVLVPVAAIWLAVMSAASFRQAAVWHDSETLWAHNYACFPDSSIANAGMGDVALEHDRFVEARGFYERAIALNPALTNVNLGLGFLDLVDHRPQRALERLTVYLTWNPGHRRARELIMEAYEAVGRTREAAAIREMLQREDGTYRGP